MLLSTAADRIEARDLATSYWHEWAEPGRACTRTVEARLHYVRNSLAVDFDARLTFAPGPAIRLTDKRGNVLVLTFDPMVDGFEYPTSGDDAVHLQECAANNAEPTTCESCGLHPATETVASSTAGDESVREYCECCAGTLDLANVEDRVGLAWAEVSDLDWGGWFPILDHNLIVTGLLPADCDRLDGFVAVSICEGRLVDCAADGYQLGFRREADVAGPRPEDPVDAERYDRAERVEEIRNALVGLPVEAKIVALVNALCDCNRVLQRRGDTIYVRLPIGDRAVLTVPGRGT